jgi:hypothetical protein
MEASGMKIVHGISILALLVLIGGGIAGLNGDLLKIVAVILAIGFWLEMIMWSANSFKEKTIQDGSAKTPSKS